MPVAGSTTLSRGVQEELSVVRTLVLARLACAGEVTRAGLARDLAPLLDPVFSASEWRDRVVGEIASLRDGKLAAETRGRVAATPAGKSAADRVLGNVWPAALEWPEQRDIRLVAMGLGMQGESAAALQGLAKTGGVRTAVVQKAFGLPINPRQSITRLRAQLAVVALERAFGNKIKSGFGQGAGLSAKAGRLLAGHLSRNPRDFGSDGRLVAALAAEQAGTPETDEAALRWAILRALVSRGLDAALTAPRSRAAPNEGAPTPSVRPLSTRPDLQGFVAEVQAAARRKAEGWPGKAYIAHVWQDLKVSAPHWALTEIEFKCMLAEAHRAGQVVLASADLKDKRYLKELEDSAIAYKNMVWHFVRVQD